MNRGSYDEWVIRLDPAGSIVWSRTAGGDGNDGVTSLFVRANGVIAAAGYSFSDDGDVHGHHGPTAYSDSWITTFDSTGTLLTEHSYGGGRNDAAQSVALWDGGLAVAGWSESHDGDVVGHHGSITPDMWLFGIDAGDTIVWGTSIGTNDRETGTGIVSTAPGQYVAVGTATLYNPSTDRHDNDDYMAVKINTPSAAAQPVASLPVAAAYPNPFSTTTTIHIPDEVHCAPGGVLILTDMLGREVKRMADVNTNDITLTRDNLREGQYAFRLYSNGQVCCEGRVVVR
jgi:hypothetical protein